MNNSVLVGISVTLIMHLGVAGGIAAFSAWDDEDKDDDKEMKFLAIEAALAFQSDVQTDLPQKPRTRTRRSRTKKVTPRPVPTEDAPPATETKKTEEAEEDFTDDVERYLRERQGQDDEESETEWEEGAEDVAPEGQFDGSKHGFAEVNKGDPYMRDLAGAVRKAWSVVALEKGTDVAEGCIRLAADGSVVDTKLWKATGNTNIDLAASNALEALKKERKPGVSPVPRHLMDATTQWICFKFTIDS